MVSRLNILRGFASAKRSDSGGEIGRLSTVERDDCAVFQGDGAGAEREAREQDEDRFHRGCRMWIMAFLAIKATSAAKTPKSTATERKVLMGSGD